MTPLPRTEHVIGPPFPSDRHHRRVTQQDSAGLISSSVAAGAPGTYLSSQLRDLKLNRHCCRSVTVMHEQHSWRAT